MEMIDPAQTLAIYTLTPSCRDKSWVYSLLSVAWVPGCSNGPHGSLRCLATSVKHQATHASKRSRGLSQQQILRPPFHQRNPFAPHGHTVCLGSRAKGKTDMLPSVQLLSVALANFCFIHPRPIGAVCAFRTGINSRIEDAWAKED